MSITIDLVGFSSSIKKKKAQIQAAIRPAAQLAAEHIYLEARMRAPVGEHAHVFYGKNSKATGVKYFFYPGNLRDSIYQVFSESNSSKNVATYHVSWNHTKAPYGYMVEYGTSRAAAHPFMRPAILAGQAMAQQIMRNEFLSRMSQ